MSYIWETYQLLIICNDVVDNMMSGEITNGKILEIRYDLVKCMWYVLGTYKE